MRLAACPPLPTPPGSCGTCRQAHSPPRQPSPAMPQSGPTAARRSRAGPHWPATRKAESHRDSWTDPRPSPTDGRCSAADADAGLDPAHRPVRAWLRLPVGPKDRTQHQRYRRQRLARVVSSNTHPSRECRERAKSPIGHIAARTWRLWIAGFDEARDSLRPKPARDALPLKADTVRIPRTRDTA